MPLKALIGPIAAATIVTAFWFAAMWRGHQMERGGRNLPRRYEAAFFAYLATLGLILYLTKGATLSTGLELFGAALVAEGMGIVVTYALVQAFVVTRGRPLKERAFPVVAAAFMVFIIAGTVLTT